MLVYYYLPMCYAKLGHRQIHGIGLGMDPIRVTHKEYLANKEILVQAPFTPEYFEKVTGKPDFPYRAYITLETVKDIQYRKLQQIATYFEVDALLPDYALQHSVRVAIKDL